MRFTLPKLFLAVAMAALACAGFSFRTRWYADLTVSLTVLLFVLVAIRAVAMHGRQRASAIAFSAVGGLYLVVSQSVMRESLITNYPLAALVRMFDLPEVISIPPPNHELNNSILVWPPGTYNARDVSFDYFLLYATGSNDTNSPIVASFLIGHCVCSWLLARLAGWLCGVMFAKREASLAAKPQADNFPALTTHH